MQKILMNYYEYDKERHIIMVDVYLLPANEGDCLWVRYGKKEGTRHNIIIDGGVESNGGDIASIIENIAERNEKVDIFVTHIDGDHIRGLIKGIGISNAEVLKKCVDTIYFNNKKDILDKFRIDSISSEGLEESIKTYIPSGKGYSISEAVSLLEILKKKEIDDKIDGCVFAGRNICIAGASLKIVSPSDKELIQFVTKCTKKVDEDGAVTKGYSANMPQNLNIDLKDLMNEKFPPADSSITNRVSIGFIFEYDDAKIAFWGDAVAPVICRGLKRFGINSEFEVDAVKTSHHGSSRNISNQLLNLIKTDTYLISSNGRTLKGQLTVPGKLGIAKMLKKGGVTGIQLLCNYKWWEYCYHNKYFTANDKCNYIENDKISVCVDAVQVEDNLQLLGQNNVPEEWTDAVGTDGNLVNNTLSYIKSGNGIDSVDEIVKTESVKQKLVYATVTYTNKSDEEINHMLYIGTLLLMDHEDGSYQIYDPTEQSGDDYDRVIWDGVARTAEMTYNSISEDYGNGGNYISSLKPGESIQVNMAWIVNENDLNNMYLNLNGDGAAYEFSDSMLKTGLVDIYQ